MFLSSPETDENCRRRWSIKTTIAGFGAMLLTTAGLALLPATAASADDLTGVLSSERDFDGDGLVDALDDDVDGDGNLNATDLDDETPLAVEEVVQEPVTEEIVEEPVTEEIVEEPVTEEIVEEPVTEEETEDPLVTNPNKIQEEIEFENTTKDPPYCDTLPLEEQSAETFVPCIPDPCQVDVQSVDLPPICCFPPTGAGAAESVKPEPCDPEPNPCEMNSFSGGHPDNCCVPPRAEAGAADSKKRGGDKCCYPQNDSDPAASFDRGDKCDEEHEWEGCDRGGNMENFSAEESREWGDKWEKECYIKPRIDIDVKNWCPTVIKVKLSNLKHWLEYHVYINGHEYDIDIHHGKAWIEIDDFDHGLLKVKVHYEKKWHGDHEWWDKGKKHGHGGKVVEKEYIHEYECPEIGHEVVKECNKIDGRAKVEIQVTHLDHDRKYLVTVEGDHYTEHFWVEDEESFFERLKLEEGDYTVTVESWAHKGGGGHYDKADVGPVVYEFTVDGCPVDVAVEPTENCKSIKAVLDTLVEGRKYIIKVKDSHGDVVFEKTVWGPTTIHQKFHQDTYKVIVIDVKARDHGDHHGGWEHDWDGGKDWEHENDVLLAAVVGDEFAYDKEWGEHDGDHEWDNDHHGDGDHHGKKGKRLKWTATITLSDCPTPPTVEPAGNDNDHGGSPSPSVGGTGGGVLATTGADPAGMALAALILLPVGGAVLATRSVIARRKNAAWHLG